MKIFRNSVVKSMSVLIIMTSVLLCPLAVSAEEKISLNPTNKAINDFANVLSPETESLLNEWNEQVSQNMELVVVSTDEQHENMQSYAEEIVDNWDIGSSNNGYGGLILYSAEGTDGNEYYIAVTDETAKIITEEKLNEIESSVQELTASGVNHTIQRTYKEIYEGFCEGINPTIDQSQSSITISIPMGVVAIILMSVFVIGVFYSIIKNCSYSDLGHYEEISEESDEENSIKDEEEPEKPEPVKEKTLEENVRYLKKNDETKKLYEMLVQISEMVKKDPEDIKHAKRLFTYYVPHFVSLYEKNPAAVKNNKTVELMENVCKKIIRDIESEDLMEVNAEIKTLEGLLKMDGYSFVQEEK